MTKKPFKSSDWVYVVSALASRSQKWQVMLRTSDLEQAMTFIRSHITGEIEDNAYVLVRLERHAK